jgi:flagellar basal body-associated protein FliL
MSHDLGIIIAIVGTGVAMVGVVMAMMFWVRQEANSLRADAKEDRKDLLQISRNLEIAVNAIQNEMKDFHYRLLEIEKSRK